MRINPLLVVPLLALFGQDALALPKAPLADEYPLFDMFGPWWNTTPPPVYPGGGGGPPPLYANPPQLVNRWHDAIELRWSNASAAVQGVAIERSVGRDGPFATIGCWGPAQVATAKTIPTGDCTAPDPGTLIDRKRERDTMYCYRSRVWDQTGTTLTSSPLCAYTQARVGAPNTEPLRRPWEARLEITTADVPGAETDDPVRVGLNDHLADTWPHGNETWLDHPDNDFERGATRTYHLNTFGLGDTSDVELLSVFQHGDDPWCVERIALVLDQNTLLERDFTDEPDGCVWLDDHPLQISHEELRAEPGWQTFEPAPPLLGLENDYLVARVESFMGHLAHYTELYWDEDNGDGATVWQEDDDTLGVGVQITWYDDGLPDATLDISLSVDVTVSCVPSMIAPGLVDATIALRPRDATVDARGWLFELGEFVQCTTEWDWNCIEEAVDEYVQQQLPSVSGGMLTSTVCPTAFVDEYGAIRFDLEP